MTAPGAPGAGARDGAEVGEAYADTKDIIMTSMLKRVDVAVFDYIGAAAAGDTSKLPKTFDLKVDGVAYATSGGKVDDIKDKLDALKKDIVDGKVKVPTTPQG